MNSKQMQATFSYVYENFFSKQKIIYSAPFTMSRTGETNSIHNGITIKQKIPLRMYIGISEDLEDSNQLSSPSESAEEQKNQSPKSISLGDIYYYDLQENQFNKSSLYEYGPFFKDIEKLIQSQGLHIDGHYSANILTELPRGAGLGFDSIFSLLLATAIQKLQNQFSSPYAQDDMIEEINDEKSETYKLIRLAHVFDSHIKTSQHIDGSIATAFCNTPLPTICFHEHIQSVETAKKTSKAHAKHSPQELFSMFDYKYFCLPLHSLFPFVHEGTSLPLDYGLIYSGRPTLTEHITGKDDKEDIAETLSFSREVFGGLLQQCNGARKPSFHTNLTHGSGPLHSILGYMSLHLLKRIATMYQRGYKEEDTKKLLQTINKLRETQNAIHTPSESLLSLTHHLQESFNYKEDSLGISYNDVNSMGGTLYFALPLESMRNTLMQGVFYAQRELPSAQLLYTSRKDGVENNGLICEQNLLEKHTSKYLNTTVLVLEKTDNTKIFGAYEDLINQKSVDIVLDTINMKIYAQGKKLTSKELHSQSGTIEMLLSTLPNIENDVHNRTLPPSSYSKSKNDMVGKIIIPFMKYVKTTLKKDLSIDCYGSMYEYFLRMRKHNIKFGVMKKVMQ